jgi:hypothetical protein
MEYDFLLWEGSSREEIGKWLKKQVYTMAEAEKVAPGSDWHIPLWTADVEVWIQENGSVHAMSEGTWGKWKQLEWRAANGENWPRPERGVPWTKGGGHRSAQCMHPGAATRSQRAWEGGKTHETPHDWDRKQVEQTLGPRTVYTILLEGRVVGSSERGRVENPVEGREWRAASIGRTVSRKILAAETGWNWIGHSN